MQRAIEALSELPPAHRAGTVEWLRRNTGAKASTDWQAWWKSNGSAGPRAWLAARLGIIADALDHDALIDRFAELPAALAGLAAAGAG